MAHLVPKEIAELPFVDRTPNPSERPDQSRIDWIRNGDCLGAAEHVQDNSGELNRGPVKVQKNAVALMENDRTISESLVEIIERVNSHDDALGAIGDDNLATKLTALEVKVEPYEGLIRTNTQDIESHTQELEEIQEKVGDRAVLDITDRSVYQDLFWVKREIGNWIGKDVNDNDVPSTLLASGLKARISTQGLSISSNERRILALENDWVQSDVGALTSKIDDIRLELGRTQDSPTPNVYRWITGAEIKHVAIDAEISSLKSIVGGGVGGESLDQRITKNTNDITTNETEISKHDDQINQLKLQVGTAVQPNSLTGKVNSNERAIAGLNTIVGEDEDNGLQKKVNDLVIDVGSDITSGSLKGRLATVENSVLDTQRDVSTLTTKVGDNTVGSETGIYKRLSVLESDLESAGTGIKTRLDNLDSLVATKVGDTAETEAMVRVNGNWAKLADHLPVRVHGGFHVIGNTTKTTLSSTLTKVSFEAASVSSLALNTANVSVNENELVFGANTSGSVVNLVLEFRVLTNDPVETTIQIKNKAGDTVHASLIKIDEWSPGKTTILRIQIPAILADQDKLTILASSDGSEVTFMDGMFYVFSI